MANIAYGVVAGNWSEDAKWVGGVKPTAADVAQLNNLSANVTIDAGAVCRSLDCSAYTGVLTHNTSATLTLGDASGGSLTFVTGMTYTPADTTSILKFASTTTGNTITFAGKTFTALTFDGVAGGWTFQDAATGSTAAAVITLTNGALSTGTFTVTFGQLASNNSNTRTLTITSSSMVCNRSASGIGWNFASVGGLTFNSGSSTISLTNAGTQAKTFAGGGLTYNDLSITAGGTGAWTFSGANTFSTFTINAPKSIIFTSTVTMTVSSFVATGSVGNVITITATSGGSAAILSKTSGTVSCDYLNLSDSSATGGAAWYAGANSTNTTGNSGWIFTIPPAVSAIMTTSLAWGAVILAICLGLRLF